MLKKRHIHARGMGSTGIAPLIMDPFSTSEGSSFGLVSTSTAVLEDRLCFLDIRLVALLLLRLPSTVSESAFLQQLQHLPPLPLQEHRSFLSHPHFPAGGSSGPDLDPSSTEALDPPIVPALEPSRIPTLEPAIDLLAKHLRQSIFLRQLENLWLQGHSRESTPLLGD